MLSWELVERADDEENGLQLAIPTQEEVRPLLLPSLLLTHPIPPPIPPPIPLLSLLLLLILLLL